MKELTLEEKAKRYDEALEKARDILDSTDDNYVCTYLTKEDIKRMYSRFFPELIESEDERIRKEIITYLSTAEDKEFIPYEGWIAWLEKQGNPIDINPTEFDTRLQSLIGKFETLPKEELIGSLSFWLNVVQNDGIYKE